jgi:mono/diheme cytochrome c family protein
MKRVLKWLRWVVVIVVAVAAGGVAYVYVASTSAMAKTYAVTVPPLTIPTDAASIARGRYLVEKISMCADCHAADLGGRVVEHSFPMGYLATPNLTRGRGGIGSRYSDQDYVRTLLHGVKPDGTTVVFMPSSDYRFTESAMASIIAYLKSVPPVDRDLARPSPGPLARALGLFADFPLLPAAKIDHERVTFAAPHDQSNPVAAGEEIVALASCRACHGPEFAGGSGPPPGGANITPIGIGGWTEPQFLTALRDHKRPNGSAISDVMPRAYGEMSTTDLHNVYEYLKTLPPKGEKTPNQR